MCLTFFKLWPQKVKLNWIIFCFKKSFHSMDSLTRWDKGFACFCLRPLKRVKKCSKRLCHRAIRAFDLPTKNVGHSTGSTERPYSTALYFFKSVKTDFEVGSLPIAPAWVAPSSSTSVDGWFGDCQRSGPGIFSLMHHENGCIIVRCVKWTSESWSVPNAKKIKKHKNYKTRRSHKKLWTLCNRSTFWTRSKSGWSPSLHGVCGMFGYLSWGPTENTEYVALKRGNGHFSKINFERKKWFNKNYKKLFQQGT